MTLSATNAQKHNISDGWGTHNVNNGYILPLNIGRAYGTRWAIIYYILRTKYFISIILMNLIGGDNNNNNNINNNHKHNE